MPTIDDIKQIAMSNEAVWPNDIHVGHYREQIIIIDNEWDEENIIPAKLSPYATGFKTAFNVENDRYNTSSGSSYTELIEAADKERDGLVAEVKAARTLGEKSVSNPAKQQAAKVFGRLWDVY